MARVFSKTRAPFSSNSLYRGGNKSSGDSSNGRKRNAIGFAKRQERKVKNKMGISDVYEYAPEGSSKRSKVDLGFTKEELMDMGRKAGGSEEDNSEDDRIARIGGNMDGDNAVLSEDDEEIDSDGAFEGESDEERFAGFKFAEKAKRGTKGSQPKRIDLNEDNTHQSASEDEDEEALSEGDGEDIDGFMDLSEVLNVEPSPLDKSTDESEGDDEGEDVLASSDEDGGENMALDELGSFIDGLGPKKRKAIGEDDGRRKRRLLSDRTEAGPEGEFSGPASSSKLRVEDLLAPLSTAGTNPSSLITLKKSLKSLSSANAKSAPVSAPLPTRTQDRLDREAAYEQTREEVKKWAPSMERIRNAEHLSFPLQIAPTPRPSTSDLTAKFKPSNELESAVDRLLKSAHLREQDVAKTEDLQMKDLSIEEIQERRAELRYSRELMFRAEAKAKRIAKIKSKTYRKIHRKLREKNQLSAEDLETLDPEAAEAERLKIEVDRARERASLRHKNGGKWVKKMRGMEGDVEKRKDLSDMLQRGEALRRKIAGDAESTDEDEPEDGDVETIKARAFDELAEIDAEDDEANATPTQRKGVFEMKFMQEAMARKLAKTNQEADDFRKELMGGDEDIDGDDAVSLKPSFVTVGGNKGRVIYQPGASTVTSSKPLVSAASDTSSVTLKSSDHGLGCRYSPPLTGAQNSIASEINIANPWLAIGPDLSSLKQARKSVDIVISKNSTLSAKSKNTLKKQLRKGNEARAGEQEDAVVEITVDNVMAEKGVSATQSKGAKNAAMDKVYTDGDDDDLEEGSASNPKAIQQRELVALAFAGDNVMEDFEAAKRREIEADAPKEEDTTIPGWGSWTGPGTKGRPPNPKFIKKVVGVDPKKRSDLNKAHVIISEKKDKKASKYQVKDLPYPYTSVAQYEKSLEVPLGPEWNTRMGFQKATLPRVVKKMGTIIDPVEKLF